MKHWIHGLFVLWMSTAVIAAPQPPADSPLGVRQEAVRRMITDMQERFVRLAHNLDVFGHPLHYLVLEMPVFDDDELPRLGIIPGSSPTRRLQYLHNILNRHLTFLILPYGAPPSNYIH